MMINVIVDQLYARTIRGLLSSLIVVEEVFFSLLFMVKLKLVLEENCIKQLVHELLLITDLHTGIFNTDRKRK